MECGDSSPLWEALGAALSVRHHPPAARGNRRKASRGCWPTA